MITLITWLTYPKHMIFYGLTYENIRKMVDYMRGPNYTLTVFLDVFLACITIIVICFIRDCKKESSSKSES